jgi:glycosyltransferase involved in cell wall biosynthesis
MGGIQKSLVNLVKEIHEEHDITLMLFSESGSLLGELPNTVKIITPRKAYRILGLEKDELKKYPLLFLLKAFLLAYSKLFSRRSAMKLLGLFQKRISGYDAVISFSHFTHPNYFANGCADFVLDKTVCENKICFLHCDYLNFGGRTEANNRAYMEFDKIACCSESVRERFLRGSALPESKVYTVRNFYDLQLASYQAEGTGLFDAHFVNVALVARLSAEKGIPRAIEALVQSERKDIRYYIIGDGPQKEKIAQLISKYQLDSRVLLLGEQSDPYQYLIHADWLLVPSFHEAAPMVFDEAKLLGVKVIATNTTSAEEMIGSEHGIVCENSMEGLVRALRSVGKSEKSVTGGSDNEKQRKQLNSLLGL